ncbi:MAG: periplasmic heavy metal sensor [Luteimonas sp.]|nr:periplasmic heavy metal sensor [Luteimonas sp.]
MRSRSLLLALGLACLPLSSLPASPYAGQDSREIKALSPEDVDSLLAGKGMGFAKVAELNGFPGPAHVLELSEQLRLNPEQRARTEALFASMSAKASAAGRALVERERELDRLFASRAITPLRLHDSLVELGRLQSQVRAAHLEAHLAQVQILTPEQNVRYAQLRGYGGAVAPGDHRHKH